MPADERGPEAARVADLIGRTPLLRLDRIAAHVAPGVRLFAKAEWHNPGGSVKDRAALGMIRAAQKSGLTKERTLLDATSGNTGIAIAMLAAAEGYPVTLCVPANISLDRRRMLKGSSMAEIEVLDRDALLKKLGIPLSVVRLKCALLPLHVLKLALGETKAVRT